MEATELNRLLPELTPRDRSRPYSAHVREAGNDSPDRAFYMGQIIAMARKHGYYAATERFRSWTRLALFTEGKFDTVISFHGYGKENTGVMAASAFAIHRAELDEGESEIADVVAVNGLFQFNYAEEAATAIRRFEDWLEDGVAIALECWRKSL